MKQFLSQFVQYNLHFGNICFSDDEPRICNVEGQYVYWCREVVKHQWTCRTSMNKERCLWNAFLVISAYLQTNFSCDSRTQFLCKNGQCIESAELCLMEYDKYGIINGCRDVTHLQDCGKYNICSTAYLSGPFFSTICWHIRALNWYVKSNEQNKKKLQNSLNIVIANWFHLI